MQFSGLIISLIRGENREIVNARKIFEGKIRSAESSILQGGGTTAQIQKKEGYMGLAIIDILLSGKNGDFIINKQENGKYESEGGVEENMNNSNDDEGIQDDDI